MKNFVLIVMVVAFFISCSSDTATGKKADTTPAAATMPELATVEKGAVAAVIKLPAQLAAFEEVSIFPKINGYVKNVFVDIGSTVKKGQLLMTLEAPELEQASLQAKEKYARSIADFSIDKERYNRLMEAAKTAGAISPWIFPPLNQKWKRTVHWATRRKQTGRCSKP
jgi:membrane fusion protein (multidrug efflux system)